MRVRLRVVGDEGGAGSLLAWLRGDPQAGRLPLDAGPDEPGSMGAAEVVIGVVQTAMALGSLLVAAAAWRDARASDRSRLVLESEDGGVKVTVEAASPQEVQRLYDMLIEADRPAPAGPEEQAGSR